MSTSEDKFLQELRAMTDQAKADVQKFLAFIADQNLNVEEKRALRIQFFQMMVDLELDAEAMKEGAAKFEKLMELP